MRDEGNGRCSCEQTPIVCLMDKPLDTTVAIAPPRSRFRAALYGLAPGAAMIAIAMGFRMDPQSAHAFSGQPQLSSQNSAGVNEELTRFSNLRAQQLENQQRASGQLNSQSGQQNGTQPETQQQSTPGNTSTTPSDSTSTPSTTPTSTPDQRPGEGTAD